MSAIYVPTAEEVRSILKLDPQTNYKMQITTTRAVTTTAPLSFTIGRPWTRSERRQINARARNYAAWLRMDALFRNSGCWSRGVRR